MPDPLVDPNGINAETGEPLLPPLPVDWVAALRFQCQFGSTMTAYGFEVL